MPKLAKLAPGPAAILKALFPPAEEHADLLLAFQRWEREDIELSPEQVRRSLDAIRRYAIPDVELSVYRSPAGPLREERREVLASWRQLEALLASAVR